MADNLPYQGEDPEPERVANQQDFGRELTLARQRAGLTVREVARAAGLPPSTAGDYFSGRHLPPPSQPALLPAILRACGETDPARIKGWANALSRARRTPGRRAADARPPYLGLASFQTADAAWFFGRSEITERLVTLATGTAAATSPATATGPVPGTTGVPLVVVGPSGSGKSSLLRAGLVPRLLAGVVPGHQDGVPAEHQASTRQVALFTPSAVPLTELAAQLSTITAGTAGTAGEIEARLSRDPASAARLDLHAAESPLIVVDQFEAVFTDCTDEDQRQAFIAAVCALSGPAIVVLALRADFYDRALRYPQLARALQERQIVLGPMSAAQVRSAIIEPARLARLDVADGLVEVLLRDLAPRPTASGQAGAAHEPGALPLLSHALLATWEHSHGSQLTVADYQAAGGISEAIARTAEAAYESLARDQRDTARRLFLRLVNAASDVPETRSIVQLSELDGWPEGGSPAAPVLARFVDERLITTDAGIAQITHDALLTAWPRLRAWIDADRDNLRIRRRVGEAAQAWAEADRDSAALLRGSQLAVAADWAAEPGNLQSLSALAREFLGSSADQERARQLTERSRTRRLHRLVAALTTLVLVTCGLAGYAFMLRAVANAARDSATAAKINADSREVAVEADQIRPQNVALAAQLSLAAYRIAATSEARASLLESSGTPAAARLTDSRGVVDAVRLSPDRRVLAVAAADGTLRLWDTTSIRQLVPFGAPLEPPSDRPLYTAAFSPDGSTLAAAGAGKIVLLWDVRDPRRPLPLAVPLTGPASTIYSIAFSPGGNILAAGSADDTVRLWDQARPGHFRPLATLTGPAGFVESVAFSPDGRWLAAGSADHRVRLWNVTDPAHPRLVGKPLTGPGDLVYSVAFSPDGRLLAAGGKDDQVWLWNVSRPGRPVLAGRPLTGATDWVNAVAFSPDGRSIAAASSDNDVHIWDVATRMVTATLPHPMPVTSLAWSRNGRLITADADGLARIWALPTPVLVAGSPVNSVAFGARGSLLAVGDRDLQLWNPGTRKRLTAGPVPGTFVNAVAFAPGGKVLAAGYGNGLMRLWRAAVPLVPLSRPVRAAASGSGLVESVAFSPDGTMLATGSDAAPGVATGSDGTVRLWSVTDPAHPRLLAKVHDSGTSSVYCVAFSPDGKTLAAASADNLTRMWDIADRSDPAPLGAPLTGPASYAMSVAFSPDGKTLAVGSADKTARLWNITDPARPSLIGTPLTGPASYVWSVAFSRDGKTLAAGVTDGTVWLWNLRHLARPALLATLTGPGAQVFSVAFGPGGHSLAAGSADGTVRLWDTSPRADARAVCASAGQPLTRFEWATYIPGLPYQPPCPAN
jgi:WD40 repeat protein/transcriptional regulator with XRE-family HTH domain